MNKINPFYFELSTHALSLLTNRTKKHKSISIEVRNSMAWLVHYNINFSEKEAVIMSASK